MKVRGENFWKTISVQRPDANRTETVSGAQLPGGVVLRTTLEIAPYAPAVSMLYVPDLRIVPVEGEEDLFEIKTIISSLISKFAGMKSTAENAGIPGDEKVDFENIVMAASGNPMGDGTQVALSDESGTIFAGTVDESSDHETSPAGPQPEFKSPNEPRIQPQ